MSGLMDIFGDEVGQEPKVKQSTPVKPEKAPEPPVAAPTFGTDLPDEVQRAAKAAAAAADAEAAAKAALDFEKETIQAKVDAKLEPLSRALKDAKAARKEAEILLLEVMQAEKITKIPMDDRPEIKIKTSPGRKLSITRKWLSDPDGIVVKTYGADAPKTIWDAVPRSEPKTEVVVPPRYEDEPEG